MLEQEQKIIIIADEGDDECNNRISNLRSQRFCQKNAKMCKEKCDICQVHGDEYLKQDHRVVSVEQFQKYFRTLQLTCNQQTEHYKRQLHEAQRNAIETIAKKKEEYLKEIEQIKIHMMKKTYRSLDEKYPRLYEKYRNMRYDTLTCCEVFWVINALPIHHNIKHSEINKKLESVLKKFENFKEVSRNVSKDENIFNNKAKAKKGKAADKLTQFQPKDPKGKLAEVFDSEKLKAYRDRQESYKRQISKLSQQLVNLKERKLNFEKSVRMLEHELNDLHRKKISKYNNNKMGIVSKIISVKWIKGGQSNEERQQLDKSIQQPSVRQTNNNSLVEAYVRQRNVSNVYSIQKSSSSDPYVQKSQEEGNSSSHREQTPNSSVFVPKNIENVMVNSSQPLNSQNKQSNKCVGDSQRIVQSSHPDGPSRAKKAPILSEIPRAESSQNNQKVRMANTLASELRGFPSFNAEPLSSIKDESKQPEKNKNNEKQAVAIDSRQPAYLQSQQSNPDNRKAQIRYTNSFEIVPLSVSSVGHMSSQRSQVNKEADKVKLEEDKSPFKPWKNSQLLDHMRKSGKKSESALKVEDIVAMSQLAFLSCHSEGHAESIRSLNSFSSKKVDSPAKSSNLKSLVDDLFDKEQKRRNNADNSNKKSK